MEWEMDRSKIDLVLQSFRQMEEGDTRKYSGIGLGLTVVEKNFDYYGEKIHINSHLNRGTEVYFILKRVSLMKIGLLQMILQE